MATSGQQSTFDELVHSVRSQQQQTLAELSQHQNLMVVFLRHAGCTFCREALSDLARDRAAIEARGIKLAFVHMSPESAAVSMFRHYQLDDVPRFSDPQQQLYMAFELPVGTFRQLAGWKVLSRGFKAALLEGHGFSYLQGNGLRMPGVFLLRDARMLAAYRHDLASDRPDYRELFCERPAELPETASTDQLSK